MASEKTLSAGLMKPATLFALGFLMLGGQNPAASAELDCGKMAESLNPGDQYEFKLEIQSKKVRLEKGDDFCTESVKDWFKRQLILPAPAKEGIRLPKKKALSTDNAPLPGQQMQQRPVPDLGLNTDGGGAAPLPIQREFVKPKSADDASSDVTVMPQEGQNQGEVVSPESATRDHVSSDPDAAPGSVPPGEAEPDPVYGVAAPPPPLKNDSLVKRCDRELVGFWSPGEHVIEGRKFWLSGVFTVDLDSDGRVDDVGFKIKAEGKIGNILNYFPATEGRLSGKTIDSLKLEDDRDIHRLCPGNVTFERPGEAPSSKKKRPASQVNVLGGAKSKKQAIEEEPVEEEPPEEEPPKEEINSIIFVVGGIALFLMLAGGIGLAFAIRNMTSSKEDEYEDDDEDEDD